MKETCLMVTYAENTSLHANDLPIGTEVLTNKLCFPDIPPCKKYLISGQTMRKGLWVHFPQRTANTLYGKNIECHLFSRPIMRNLEKAFVYRLAVYSPSQAPSALPACLHQAKDNHPFPGQTRALFSLAPG